MICLIGMPKEKKKEQRIMFSVIMTKNLSKLMTDTKPQIQEAQRTK